MTSEEEKILKEDFHKFIKETRENFGRLFQDRIDDAKRLDEIYIAVGNSNSKTHTLVSAVEEQTGAVAGEVKDLKDILRIKPMVIVERGLTLKGILSTLISRGNKNAKEDLSTPKLALSKK